MAQNAIDLYMWLVVFNSTMQIQTWCVVSLNIGTRHWHIPCATSSWFYPKRHASQSEGIDPYHLPKIPHHGRICHFISR